MAAVATGTVSGVRKKKVVTVEQGPVDLPMGKAIGGRWKIVEKLGEGGCGAVYLVEDQKLGGKAALKAESTAAAGGSVLKLEVQILRRLQGKKFVAQLLASGKKDKYCYMAIGMKDKNANIVHLLDFGLAREYVLRENGKCEMRRPRDNTLFRGTTKYCSPSSHKRLEQGRPDDLWSMMYVLAEMREPLPWEGARDKHEISRIKDKTPDRQLLKRSPPQMVEITTHLHELNYFTRPDYHRIYLIFDEIMLENKVKFTDALDWDVVRMNVSNQRTHGKKPIPTVTEDVSVAKTSMDAPKNDAFPKKCFTRNALRSQHG
uniref:Protein kinase domain-containing protein n=1 Tax=Panagrolaimus sp. JU765 TaxID=591449 RepID=A0AC34RBY2_9BILA